MTIRLRLTLLFVALMAALGLAWSIALVGGLSLTLARITEQDVRNKVVEIAGYLQDLDAELRQRGRPLALESFDALPRALSDDGMYLQLTALDGHPLNRSPNLGTRRLPLPRGPGVHPIALPLLQPGASAEALMAAQPLTLPGRGTVGWVQAAYPLQGNTRTLTRFAILAFGSWLLMIAAASLAGYLFAGRALAPVAAMTDEVRRMRVTDLPRRLPVPARPLDELGRLAATFNELFEHLESALEAQRRFVADASHELKSPLTAILGHLQLIRRRGPEHPAAIPGWAEAAEREAGRLTRLVEGLLDLARADEGQLAMARARVDLAALAREVAELFAVIAPRVAYHGDGAPAWVVGDRDRLKQVLINLVDNAVRATREGGEVSLETLRVGDRVALVVADSGIGMAPTLRENIFKRFYRADAARDRAHGGSGLGLSITAAIVEAHNGEIDVASELGHGSRFRIELAAAPPSDL